MRADLPRTRELQGHRRAPAIDFGALTLLFGANSAGKSTVLQALLYLHEVLERGLADVDRTELGGNVLELGGFARLVHRHELTRAIVLRAEFATTGGLDRLGRELADFPFPDLDDDIEAAWLELTIRHRTTAAFTGAVVERAVIGVSGDSEPLVWLELGASLREGEPLNVRVNLGHPLLATDTRELEGAIVTEADGSKHPLTARHAPADLTEAWEQIAVPEHVLHGALEAEGGAYGGGFGAGAGLGDGSGFGDGRSLPVFAVSRSRMSALPPLGEPLRVIPFGEEDADVAATVAQVRTFLEMVVLGTVSQLAEALRDALYIGPLRALPPRGFLYEGVGRITSWADGLAAWDLLLADRSTLVEDTNKWLTRLGAGCQLVVQQLYDSGASAEELTHGHVDKTARRLLLDTGSGSMVLPSEVGAGVSQVMPVVVAALRRQAGLALVEQPEIHVHPAMQVGLGDLLIDAATRDSARRTFLIETHSEHLFLRLLRRIRETTEGELGDDAPKFSPDKCRRADAVYDAVLSWLENGVREHDRRPFAGILATQNPRGHAAVLLGNDLDPNDARWAQSTGATAQRTPEGLAAALTAMLANCRVLHLVDPHFGPENARHRRVLEALMGVLATNGVGPELVRVHCLSKSTLAFLEGEAAKTASRLPPGITVEFRRWSQRDTPAAIAGARARGGGLGR